MNNRTFVKHALLAALVALQLLPAVASADDTVPDVADIHVGVAGFGVGGDADPASGAGLFADGEAGWHVGHLDLTGFAAYATRHVDANFDDGSGTNSDVGHYRMHLLDLGLRATLRFTHAYGGFGVAFENEIDDGTYKSGSAAPMQINNSDEHVAGELRFGAIVNHIDVSASMMFGEAFGDSIVTARLGVGYRF